MGKIILYSAVSLDGFIAKKNGNVDWLKGYEDEGTDYGYSEFYKSIESILMGKHTYEQILSFDIPFPYGNKRNYVFSKTLESASSPNTKIIKDKPLDFINELKKVSTKNIWLVGGGQLNGLLLKKKLIDELILSVIPVILGEGIPLFKNVQELIHFNLNKVETYESGIVQQCYSLK
ncbi:dihydrofolate reductase family protein [Carboxylicivirga linearis]|uniref:Dihydrofolate reductase n=1 Tax=Carboxylicivirga linearis TaxID=1628157 RepID=A0ABS5JU89_9BACT|nr:dihydrofolate reductase family protein [Carboxylicivirga linearis]MBS2098452.1 dihydrofolate reductase [Carboxylicivirga linearis]